MLIDSKSFNIKGYEIPKFTLSKGEMIRFWIQILPKTENDIDDFFVAKKIQEKISNEEKIKICENKIKIGFWDLIKTVSIGEHLTNKLGLNEKEVGDILNQFELKSDWKVKNLGTAHQKIFSIICGIQKNKIVTFDYYGLSPNTAEQLTKFIKKEIAKGKAALAFDNFNFMPKNSDSENIINLKISRKKTEENT